MFLNHAIEPLELRNDALQCAIASVSIRFAAIKGRDRPGHGVGVVGDCDDNDSQRLLAIGEGPKLGDNQPLDLFLCFWSFFHLDGLLPDPPSAVVIIVLVQEPGDLRPQRFST